jgi:5-formyltetrahydrofolate cyclo-ligase
MTTPQPSKSQLRTLLRQRRRSVPEERRSAAADAALNLISQLPQWHSCQRLALYSAADGEFDPVAIADAAQARGIACFLPVLQADRRLAFARWDRHCPLQSNRLGIPEPGPDAPRCPAADIDIMLVPLVGWDRHGTRLGMGGGYYDHTLQHTRPRLLMGLAFAVQESPGLPREEWDVVLDCVLTERELVSCGPLAG